MLAFLTTADTEILAARTAVERLGPDFPKLRTANPIGADPKTLIDELLADGTRVLVARILGGRRGWPEGIDELVKACKERNVTLLALGGEAEPDAEMTALSTAPAGAVAQAGEYLRHGDVDNIGQLLCFLADTFLLTGHGFEPPKELPDHAVYKRVEGSPMIGFCFYRSHFLSGNTQFVDAFIDAVTVKGAGVTAAWSYSLRPNTNAEIPVLAELGQVDALVVTMLATGGSGAAEAEHWDAGALAQLDVPVIQAVTATQPRTKWQESDSGLQPLDAATQVAIPEFDGRLQGGVISFKERDSDGVARYVADTERTQRVAGLAIRHAQLRHKPNKDKRVAVLLTAFPTKHARIGMAVGLDTPASALALLDALDKAGYQVDHDLTHGDQLMHALIGTGGHDPEFLTDQQLSESKLRLPVSQYLRWYEQLPAALRESIENKWGPPPGNEFVDGDDFVIAGLELGNILIAIQPPRGYGEDPVAIYHDPELPPTHHYLACYRFFNEFDAIVHLGKHGTLEWTPGKMLALSNACAPDAALADIPLIYPFVVNDPGEGVQAKRRAHALIVDHLVPPMQKADTYGDLAELEYLLDEYARLEVLDPPKLPALASRIWSAIQAANLQADLNIEEQPEDLGALVEHIDGYLCEVKDIQIKDGLHILGSPPTGEQLQGLIDAIKEGDPTAENLETKIAQSTNELTAIVDALSGRFIQAGPSGAPTRGRHDVLPTGRNFYSVDPRSLPNELSWEVGQKLADALLQKHGSYPKMVGLTAWGTAAMRTGGDDVAEILALLGVRPVWNAKTKRVTGVEAIPLDQLGRPRIDVTVRISGFFRDAFGHLIDLIDDAVALVAGLDEPPEMNFVRANTADLAGDVSTIVTRPSRIFGSKPGTYGAGLLQLLETRDWRGDEDLAKVYEAWGGYAYGRGRSGEAASAEMRAAFGKIELAVKNVDSNEHDILDSDDYYQYHGGMVATVRALTGNDPAAYVGDSSKPTEVRTRTLSEETRRVFRARVANPRWIGSMIRHGYKGAAELSATVDYLFGYDAVAGVADDWMYEQVAERYLLDPEVAEFMSRSNPWAARAIAERLLEAADRGMWSEPQSLDQIRERYLALEGELESNDLPA
ncbi:MAG: cobaltochelatase subunit CobN [Solirubrobacterales bacterium]|nr:cobaltochelatase subunit CobN [Solirubrobacterales bacterium]